ncbi:carboxymuconolactone decarboxylase family protein [Streptomyces sp. NPDC015492]|uniref:carboxymuconolactone decarboxylase family protein n=1 Tax=Streptomyces sp. NPDC015492 TaxID=3364958 RepID=UPI0036FA5F85
MARIPYPGSQDLSNEAGQAAGAGSRLRVHAMMSHATGTFRQALSFAAALFGDLSLPDDLREMAILQTAYALDARYISVQHETIAVEVGISPGKIEALRAGNLARTGFTEKEKVLVTFVEEILMSPRADENVFSSLSKHFTSREIVEIVELVGGYWLLSRLCTVLDIAPEKAIGNDLVSRFTDSGELF